jgi:hypothetical protein
MVQTYENAPKFVGRGPWALRSTFIPDRFVRHSTLRGPHGEPRDCFYGALVLNLVLVGLRAHQAGVEVIAESGDPGGSSRCHLARGETVILQ